MVIALGWLLSDSVRTTRQAINVLVFAVAYATVAYWVDSRPARDNVGPWGGLINHPFRASDDYNRLLAVIALVVGPGRFVTGAGRDFIGQLRSRRQNSTIQGGTE